MASIFDFNTLAPGAPFPKDKLVPFPEEVDVTIKTRGARAYPKDRDERKQIMDVVVAWLKTALVEAHHMKEVKEAAVKILQVVGIPAHPLKPLVVVVYLCFFVPPLCAVCPAYVLNFRPTLSTVNCLTARHFDPELDGKQT
jgi:hypothetical protein